MLKRLTFKELVVRGKPLANELIKSLLELHIGDSNMTDSLTARLREMAPTLFSEDDATISKGEREMGNGLGGVLYKCFLDILCFCSSPRADCVGKGMRRCPPAGGHVEGLSEVAQPSHTQVEPTGSVP